jgi:hypothetical protein
MAIPKSTELLLGESKRGKEIFRLVYDGEAFEKHGRLVQSHPWRDSHGWRRLLGPLKSHSW